GPGYLLIPHAKQSEHEITTTKYKNRKKRAKRSLIPNLPRTQERSARFLVLATLRRLNLIESQLEITKTESCLIALSAKFAVKTPLTCLSPMTPYILAPRSVYAFIRCLVFLPQNSSSLESWNERRDSSARFGDLGKDRRIGRSLYSKLRGGKSSRNELLSFISFIPFVLQIFSSYSPKF
ncbi:hypothetical protein IGI04_014988, partial [Brassica rapa subsp. trilocularis]